jgi:hypothetical protein
MFLTLCSTDVVERVGQFVSHLIPDHPADADPTGLSKGLQSRGDVNAIVENVVPFGDHIAQVDPDAELDPLLWRGGGVPIGHRPLHLHRATHRVNHALELGKEAVAGVLHRAPAMFPDLRLDQLPKVRPQPLVRPLLIRREYPATSAARIAVRRRTEDICRPAVGRLNQV